MRLLRACKNFKGLISGHISNLSIFKKLIISFVIIVILPLLISFYVFQNTVNNLIVGQISSETMNSIKLISNSFDDLLKKMSSIALYVNEDEGIKDLMMRQVLNEATGTALNPGDENLSRLGTINKFNSIISNIAFNMMRTRCFITIITTDGQRYTNWPNDGKSSDTYLEKYISGENTAKGTNLIWKGIEKNYVESDAGSDPYVFTLVKNIYDSSGKIRYGTFIISVPEKEISRLLASENRFEKRVILDSNMNVVSSTMKEWLDKPFRDICGSGFPPAQNGYFTDMVVNGDESIFSYNTIGGWKIVDIKSYDSITEQLNSVRNGLILINALFVLVFLAISALLARNISKPLRRLTALMLKTDLESSYTVQPGTRHDEIGILEGSFNIMRNNIKTLIQDNMEKERKKRDAELKSLQAQISPHFLFNTLNAVRWAAINNNTKKAADMVLALSNLLRMTVVKGDELITVEQELENLKNYSAIFQMRHSIEFELVSNMDDEIKNYRIPKLLLQPLVENSIIHGFDGITSGGIIEISGSREEDCVIIRVKDNGTGIDTTALPENEDRTRSSFSGIGIKNVDERIKLYYGEKYGLTITGRKGFGTTAEIRLPLPDGTVIA